MKPLSECLLYAFIDTAFLRGRAPVALAGQLCDGGADLIQLRAKNSPPDEIRRMAEAIVPVARQSGVGLVINDHLAVAQAVGAEVCHLGQEDFSGYGKVTQLPGMTSDSRGERRPFIGLSTHEPAEARRALEAGADYIAIGPVYATATKPGARPVTLDYVRWAAENVTAPWFVIGGINLGNLDEVLAAGARRVCAVSAILDAPDVAAACAAFKKRLQDAAA
jgi:thiamine-phosphate pyrophosphorylase